MNLIPIILKFIFEYHKNLLYCDFTNVRLPEASSVVTVMKSQCTQHKSSRSQTRHNQYKSNPILTFNLQSDIQKFYNLHTRRIYDRDSLISIKINFVICRGKWNSGFEIITVLLLS